MRNLRTTFAVVVATGAISTGPMLGATAEAGAPVSQPAQASAQVLVSGLQGAMGSTVGPDGALYVTEAIPGRVTRVDPRTGHRSTYADGLPPRVVDGLGGAMDVAFVGHRAYVLVTMVSADLGGTAVDGIYRMDDRHHFNVVADIGAYSLAHPPATAFFVPTGVQYALQPYRGGFLVTDGHHNRVLQVGLGGRITERVTFDDIVPTGLATRGHAVVMAEAGPVPHLPDNGRVVRLDVRHGTATPVASGAPLLVDVEYDCRGRLFALSQGHFTPGNPEGSPADPGTGALERVRPDGTMTPVVSGLDRPTSLELIGSTAYVVSLAGSVERITTAG